MGKENLTTPVLEPSLGEEEKQAVGKVLDSRWIGLGPQTTLFEEKFADYLAPPCGVPKVGKSCNPATLEPHSPLYAVGTNSGTAALLLALKAAGVAPGDEVITPSLNFVSAAHCITQLGARPVFADVEDDTLTIGPGEVRANISPRTKAVVVMHYAGHPCDMNPIRQICSDQPCGPYGGIVLIEDAAHALGATYRKQKIGTFGDFACFSFHAVKPITTGEGGMVVCRDREAAERMKRLRWLGISKGTFERTGNGEQGMGNGENPLPVPKSPPDSRDPVRREVSNPPSWQYDVTEVGWKCHMHDISAVIGLEQLKKIDQLWEKRNRIAERYLDGLADLDWLRLPTVRRDCVPAWHLFVVRAEGSAGIPACGGRDELHSFLKTQGVTTGVHYIPNHLFSCYAEHTLNQSKAIGSGHNDADLPVTNREWEKLLSLPIPHDLSPAQQGRIIELIRGWRG